MISERDILSARLSRSRSSGLRNRLVNTWRRVSFRMFQSHKMHRPVVENLCGFTITILPGVFNPKMMRTGGVLAEVVNRLNPGGGEATVLDLGTGSGICALVAGRLGMHVTAVDINPIAVECAAMNIEHHHLTDRVDLAGGDLFEPVRGRRFDLILFNPPFYSGTPDPGFDQAMRSSDVLERFVGEVGDHLSSRGRGYVILSDRVDEATFVDSLREKSLSVAIYHRENWWNECLTIYEIRVVDGSATGRSEL